MTRTCPHCGADITDALDASYEHGYELGYEKRGMTREDVSAIARAATLPPASADEPGQRAPREDGESR